MASNPTQTTAADMETISVQRLDKDALVLGANNALAAAREFVIDSDEMYALAADELADVKARKDRLEEMRLSVSRPLDQALKAHNAIFRAPREALEDAERVYKSAMLTWQDKKEAERREQQRLADEQARREREAQQAEAQRQADIAAAAAAEAKQAETAEQRAQAAERSAAAEAAATAAAITAEVSTAPVVHIAAPKVAGLSVRGTWKAEVTDKLALIRHIAAHGEAQPDLLLLIDVNDSALNKRAKALESALNLPGVEARLERSLASRRA